MATRNPKTSKKPAPQVSTFAESVELLEELIDLIDDEDLQRAAVCFQQVAQLIEIGDWCNVSESENEDAMRLVAEGVAAVRVALSEDQEAADQATAEAITLSVEIATRFGDQLAQTIEDDPWFTVGSKGNEPEDADESAPQAPSAEEIGLLLSQLSPPTDQPASEHTKNIDTSVSDQQPIADAPDNDQVIDELREAFLDDAGSCLAAMEQAMLALESDPTDTRPLQDLGRELHTLKGASASIGLNRIAKFIHEVEDAIRVTESKGDTPDPQQLLGFVDSIREKVEAFRQPSPPQISPAPPTQSSPQTTQSPTVQTAATPVVNHVNFDEGQSDDETVRIKASRLNRLMDMLSELVMLRNERDSELANLMTINESLVESVSRLRMIQQAPQSQLRQDLKAAHQSEIGIDLDDGTQVADVASDILESAHQLRDCYEPVANGNHAVSQFIRNFRNELVELRRSPISGLFLRLRRAVSDAARSEEKQVKLKLEGETTGIDRSLQGRVFEPMLHIVRNSVSHGIESPAVRKAAGKTEFGTITMKAYSGPDLLVIEISDDGGGLDYDAIRRRGQERGLIAPNSSTSHEELAQLIFHPGFSTRDTANQISGRGVGMDVVAAALQRMRGWIEIDSIASQGTTIRLSLPLPSMIQHAMVFRSNGQLFAMPMQSVQSAGAPDKSYDLVHVNHLLGFGAESKTASPEMILFSGNGVCGEENASDQVAILVDEIVGPEEVVVRPLPKLFKQHPVCSGATLSSLGEPVLLLDPKQLVLASQNVDRTIDAETESRQKVLVVDDSATARLRVVNSLGRYGFDVVQARNGQEAWERLQEHQFAGVFSDIDMPRINGMQLLTKIKQDATQQDTPVTLISGRNEETIHQQATALGAVACLQKPISDTALDAVLQQMSLAPATSLL